MHSASLTYSQPSFSKLSIVPSISHRPLHSAFTELLLPPLASSQAALQESHHNTHPVDKSLTFVAGRISFKDTHLLIRGHVNMFSCVGRELEDVYTIANQMNFK